MAKEKNLTNVTTVAAADFVRVVTSAGASVKGTMENLAKSLLTTAFSGLSLGGSQQSVKDALDSLNSKKAVESLHTKSALDNLESIYANCPNGFSTQVVSSSTGPVYLALVYKYNATYGCAILMTYAPATESSLVFTQLTNGTWTGGFALR